MFSKRGNGKIIWTTETTKERKCDAW